MYKAQLLYQVNCGCYRTDQFGGEVHFSVSLCTKATNTNTVVAPKVKVSKFSKLFLQTYKTYSSLMKQSYRFERFLLSSVNDIPRVQLRYRELNDTQQALCSSSLLCNRQLCTPNDVKRPNSHVLAAHRISHIFGSKWPTSRQEN